MRTYISVAVSVWLLKASAGEFINLNFDSARTNNLTQISRSYYTGLTTDLLPGWNVSAGLPYRDQLSILYSSDPKGITANSSVGVAPSIEGYGYSIVVDPNSFEGGPIPVKLWQVGTIPIWARTLEFDGLISRVEVDLNGRLSIVAAGRGSLDVSEFAGSEVTLTLGSSTPSTFRLDGMRFTAVPEPSVGILSFVTIGGMMMFWIVRKS